MFSRGVQGEGYIYSHPPARKCKKGLHPFFNFPAFVVVIVAYQVWGGFLVFTRAWESRPVARGIVC